MSRMAIACLLFSALFPLQAQSSCPNGAPVVFASVVAFDQVMVINRLGTIRPAGMMYALSSDVVPASGTAVGPGNAQLKPGKRPRPLVLRVHEKECLQITFQNLLSPSIQPVPPKGANGLPLFLPSESATRNASIHVAGMQLVNSIADDGTFVGANPMAGSNFSGVVPPGGKAVYTLYAAARGSYLMYSAPADFNGFDNPVTAGPNAQLTLGLFGAVNVEPPKTEWYRSQTDHEDFLLAAKKVPDANSAGGFRYEINYDATYPSGKPILKMLDSRNNLVYGDLTAVITGPNHGLLPARTENPALPNREMPYREVTIHYHESQDVVQAFPWIYNTASGLIADPNAGLDGFAINYGAAGITPEIYANRFQLGPMRDCQECKFEEFFLNSWTVGDPAMVVDNPANLPCTNTAPNFQMLSTAQASNPAFASQIAPPAPCAPGAADATGKLPAQATKAFFPDDPSNVYHSYLGDHVQFQILHAGSAVHHVHHHHAHQWVHSPDSPGSSYLDSQAIGPGASFSLDLVYKGSGNQNLTAGDSIFHCHFYPHFASGMWALFRVHDVFEEGTQLDSEGRPATGSRALPDGEILAGTPIPAVIPLPTQGMAPMPGKVQIVDGQVKFPGPIASNGKDHPGFPFFIPGIAGHRPPHPPLDFANENGEELNGGLPRHIIRSATVANEQHSSTDFSKDLGSITAVQVPEKGTPLEQNAMAYYGIRAHASFTPQGAPANFFTNGLPRKSAANPTGAQLGAPFADPGVDENGKAVGDLIHGKPRIYKGVNLQVDTVFNKKGWHYPQQRMIALWGDVEDLRSGRRAPEPFFFRANAGDLVEYWHSNLIPAYYELDDFQVRTPTDILGQHIHLVKFDVMASDGAANGFNYEDGTFSPDEVRSRIAGINLTGGLCAAADCAKRTILTPKAIKAFGSGPKNGPKNLWLGAQATVQRWYVDSKFNTEKNDDRTYLTIFTHDHFGPSTHQMAGLYGGLLVEPPCAVWTSPDGRQTYGTRSDGGPTSYAANIIPAAAPAPGCQPVESYREFALAWGDLQLAYQPTSRSLPDCYPGQSPDTAECKPLAPGATYSGWADPANAINCPGCSLTSQTPATSTLMNGSFGFAAQPTTPHLVSDFGNGIFSMNYRAEPLPLRATIPVKPNPQASPLAADLSHVFRSIPRYDAAMSTQPQPLSLIDPNCKGPSCFKFPIDCHSPKVQPGPGNGCGVGPADPYTPMFRAYEGDRVQMRLLAGAHTSMHQVTVHGQKWLFEPFNLNSGYRNSQFAILSEHYELLFKMPRVEPGRPVADYLYSPSASYEGMVNGTWGLVRSYKANAENLARLPNNATPSPGASVRIPDGTPKCTGTATHQPVSEGPCIREFHVSAVSAKEVFGPGGLLYNTRGAQTTQPGTNASPAFGDNPLRDPDGLVYVVDDGNGKILPPRNAEPLVLRANAGDWIKVTLTNRLRPTDSVFVENQPTARIGQYTTGYNANPVRTSTSVGLHPQLVGFDITTSNGMNAGANPVQTAAPGGSVEYLWYAGDLQFTGGGWKAEPMELGTINLFPSDPLSHVYHGLFASLIVEPKGSKWRTDTDYRAAATVFPPQAPPFREFVLMAQNDINLLVKGQSFYAAGNPLSAFNYRTEPFFYRFGSLMNAAMGSSAPADWANLTSNDLANLGTFDFGSLDTTLANANQLVGGDPQTPIFRAPGGMPVRFRLADPGGIGDNQQLFELTGHVWQEEPYLQNSTVLGNNPRSNYTGTTTGYGPTSHFDVLIDSAGGANKITGDYRYRSWTGNQYQAGLWGLFRVGPAVCTAACPDTVTIASVRQLAGGFEASGAVTVSPAQGTFADGVTLSYGGQSGQAQVNREDGTWIFRGSGSLPNPLTLTATSRAGGIAIYQATLPPRAPASISSPLKPIPKATRK